MLRGQKSIKEYFETKSQLEYQLKSDIEMVVQAAASAQAAIIKITNAQQNGELIAVNNGDGTTKSVVEVDHVSLDTLCFILFLKLLV
jgi:hypothetical protein